MSYPYLSDVVMEWTGYDLPLPLATFGFFVAIAAIVAGGRFKSEIGRLYAAKRIGVARIRRKEKNGVAFDFEVPPQETVSNLLFVVVFAGIVGARLFHILEHLDQFVANPWEMIFSRSGLSVFGGLIFGTLSGLICVKRWHLPVRPLLDAAAPAMMLGYAIGRIGCQVSGDGDWGIAANMSLKPDWLPAWFWAQTYEHNIVGVQIPLPGVYPTSVYETIMGLACFFLLWMLRKHPFRMGWLFSLYLTLAGAERLLIEQIRVNPTFHVLGTHATQAELIATILIVLGIVGTVFLGRRSPCETFSASASIAD